MPASLPGSTLAQNQGNPSAGPFVIFDLLSGPKNSPFDAKTSPPGGGARVNDPLNLSTGALSTGIGFGCNHIIGPVAPASIVAAGFNDDYTPGATRPDSTAAVDSKFMYIGGGKSNALGAPVPYVAGFGIGGAGNGGSRDAGAGPAFTGFTEKMVTAVGAVANGAAIEAGFVNRNAGGMVAGQSAFGSSAAASAAPA
jgi:hypothetical protein